MSSPPSKSAGLLVRDDVGRSAPLASDWGGLALATLPGRQRERGRRTFGSGFGRIVPTECLYDDFEQVDDDDEEVGEDSVSSIANVFGLAMRDGVVVVYDQVISVLR
jgi:hypothetical protein